MIQSGKKSAPGGRGRCVTTAVHSFIHLVTHSFTASLPHAALQGRPAPRVSHPSPVRGHGAGSTQRFSECLGKVSAGHVKTEAMHFVNLGNKIPTRRLSFPHIHQNKMISWVPSALTFGGFHESKCGEAADPGSGAPRASQGGLCVSTPGAGQCQVGGGDPPGPLAAREPGLP